MAKILYAKIPKPIYQVLYANPHMSKKSNALCRFPKITFSISFNIIQLPPPNGVTKSTLPNLLPYGFLGGKGLSIPIPPFP